MIAQGNLSYVLSGLLCVLFGYFGYTLDLAFLNRQLGLVKQQTTELQQQLHQLETEQMLLARKVDQFVAAEVFLAEEQKKIIKWIDVPKLVTEISHVAVAKQLQYKIIKLNNAVLTGDYTKLPVKILLQGNYQQISSFVQQMANLPWLTVPGDLTVTRFLPRGSSALFTAEMNLDIYAYA